MTLHEIVMKLVGPVQPVGESYSDEQRLKNMQELTELVDALLDEIHHASKDADRVESSMKIIGQHARSFLATVVEWYDARPVAKEEE